MADAGAIVYINGVEVWRVNLPTDAVTATTLGTSTGFGKVSAIPLTTGPSLSANAVTIGTNIIAVELHQHTLQSTRGVMALQLNAEAKPSLPQELAAALFLTPTAVRRWIMVPQAVAVVCYCPDIVHELETQLHFLFAFFVCARVWACVCVRARVWACVCVCVCVCADVVWLWLSQSGSVPVRLEACR